MGDFEEKMQKTMKKLYDRICNFISEKNMALAAIGIFILLMLPIGYLSFVNRASGDDYGYGTLTRAAWVTTHSLIKVFGAAWQTIREYYVGWQGTWFSIFLFSLQPEVFDERAYVIVAFLMLFLWIGSTFLMLKEILCRGVGMNIWSYRLAAILLLIISIEFIPSTKSAIFWYNGAAHYMIPFTMCQLLVVFLLRYGKKFELKYFVGITGIMALLGGSNYQAALFALIVAFYIGAVSYAEKKDKRILWLLISFIVEMTGLIISMKAPGNRARGGEEFGFSIQKGIKVIGLSFIEGVKTAFDYGKENPLIYAGLFFLFLFIIESLKRSSVEKEKDSKFCFTHPILSIAGLFCLYCAMQTPALYAGVDVSGGVYNMNYQIFLLSGCGILLIIAKKIVEHVKVSKEILHRKATIPGLLVCFIALIICRSDIRGTASWISLEYIMSGQASDYKEQMDLQTSLLLDESTENVVLPFINDVQGPLMHMPVIEDTEAFTNSVTSHFYGKNSVVAIPRPEWDEKYGK